jgi:hypothetical protein
MSEIIPTSGQIATVRRLLGDKDRAYAKFDELTLMDNGEFSFLVSEIDVVRIGGVYYIVFYSDKAIVNTRRSDEELPVITFTIPLIYNIPKTYVVTHDLINNALAKLMSNAVRTDEMQTKADVDSTFYMYIFITALESYMKGEHDVVFKLVKIPTFRGYLRMMKQLLVPHMLVRDTYFTRGVLGNIVFGWSYTAREVYKVFEGATLTCGYIDPSIIFRDPSSIELDCLMKVTKSIRSLISEVNKLRFKQYMIMKGLHLHRIPRIQGTY